MFVPHARVHLSGVPHKRGSVGKKKVKAARRRVGVREILRMPCLMPTILVVFLGLVVLAGGAGMCVLGYIPDKVTTLSEDGNTTTVTLVPRDARYYATKSLSYTGPILMGCGFFAIIVSCVLYCEIVDRYAVLMPTKPDKKLKRQDLMEMILGDFKKSYFRGIEVPLRKEEPPTQKREREKETLLKALSISTPVLLMSPDLAPTWRFSHYPYRYPGHRHFALKPRHPKLKQLGQSGSSGHEPWLKTSSLPNICDPDIRRHNLPRPVPLDQNEAGKARRLKRFGRPSRSMESRISWSLPQTLSRSATGVDNPAYLHEQDRKKSVSMCVHAPVRDRSSIRRPQSSRFVKASQLQPRVRLQQQQQQQIERQQQQLAQQQKEQQLLQQQRQQQHHHHHRHPLTHQHSQQSQPRVKQQRSRDSDEGYRRRCDSDDSRPRQRPKLVRTKGAHKSFDSHTEDSFAALLPLEPPPFPLPAHFMVNKTPDTLTTVSPRTAKLLKARCKSEDVRDKKKPDIMLLKDLFKSFDAHDSPPQPPQPHLLTVSQPAFASSSDPGLTFLDPLAGQRCEPVKVISHSTDTVAKKTTSVGTGESAFVRVITTGSKPALKKERVEPPESNHQESHTTNQEEQRYELPLLSGVLRSSSQWEVHRKKKITSDSRNDEKSHSLDAKEKVSSLDIKRTEIQRAHSFNVAECGKTPTQSSRSGKPIEKESSNFLRVFYPNSHKSRPKSWDGDKSQSLDVPNSECKSKGSFLTVPRIERASSFDPMSSQSRNVKQTKHLTSQSAEVVHSSLLPCKVSFENETKDKSRSEEIRQKTPVPITVRLQIPTPQKVQKSPEKRSASKEKQHQRQPVCLQPQPRQQTQHQKQPEVKVQQAPASPQRSTPKEAVKQFSVKTQFSSPHLVPQQNQNLFIQPEKRQKRDKTPPPPPQQQQQQSQQQQQQQQQPNSQPDPSSQQSKTLPQSQSQGNLKRPPTIVHHASVHLSLDSGPDVSSMTSSTPSSTENNSSSAPLIQPTATSPPTTHDSGYGGSVARLSSSCEDQGTVIRRMRLQLSRSVAVEESSPEDEDTEHTPLIHHGPGGSVGGGTSS